MNMRPRCPAFQLFQPERDRASLDMTSTNDRHCSAKRVEQRDFSAAAYIAAFGWDSANPANSKQYESTSRLAKAYEVALDIRKFEIELYWKRSTNFWVFIAAIAAALGAFATTAAPVTATTGGVAGASLAFLDGDGRTTVCLVLSLAGALLCLGWFTVNRAGKIWQRNWEYQVGLLEQEVVGPLYKTVLLKKNGFKKSAHFSSSDLNQWVSIYIGLMFAFAALYWAGVPGALAGYPGPVAGTSTMPLPSAGRTVILAMHLAFAALAYRLITVRTNNMRNNLDIDIEATLCAVTVDTIHTSRAGQANLTPGAG
ncbi:hypothetical protein AB2N08_02900 [Massilia aurea]|uniref:RipA family octameric membrane protein n=1 Tax=Massilia aurea TaxID=373040 RepID=UPI0034632985